MARWTNSFAMLGCYPECHVIDVSSHADRWTGGRHHLPYYSSLINNNLVIEQSITELVIPYHIPIIPMKYACNPFAFTGHRCHCNILIYTFCSLECENINKILVIFYKRSGSSISQLSIKFVLKSVMHL